MCARALAPVCVPERDARLEHENATFVFKGLGNVESHAYKSHRDAGALNFLVSRNASLTATKYLFVCTNVTFRHKYLSKV